MNFVSLQTQRLLGLVAVHCAAHKLNLIHGAGLECVPLAVQVNALSTVINTDSFQMHMHAAQAEHHPNTLLTKLRFVSILHFTRN